jgi:hypothetical protein
LKLKSFDRQTIRLLRERIDSALHQIAQEYGISITAGNARFTPENVRLKLELAVIGENGVESIAAVDFRKYAILLGLKSEDLGKTFLFRGKPYTIVGAKTSSHKYPILAKNKNGKVYKFQSQDVMRLLKTA